MQELERRLETLDANLGPIKAFSGLALSHDDADEVVSAWSSEFSNRLKKSPQSLLPLLYAANDVVQEGKFKKKTNVVDAFARVLGASLEEALEADMSLFSRITRMIDVWEERKIFHEDFLDDAKARVGVRKAKKSRRVVDAAPSDDATTTTTPLDVVRRHLREIDLPQLVAYLDSLKTPVQLPNEPTSAEIASRVSNASTTDDVAEASVIIRARLAAFDAERIRRELHDRVVRDVVVAKLERLAERAEADLERSANEAETCERLEAALAVLDESKISSSAVVRHKLVKRRKIQEETKPKKETPMVYDKRLKKYVPLPSFDSEASWRDT